MILLPRIVVPILLAASLSLHFIGIWHPKEAVFDEVHFGKFVSSYFTGEYYFDIHPPLGKLMVAGVAVVSGFEPKSGFLNIGEGYPDYHYVWLRSLPALFGSLLPALTYLLTLRIAILMRHVPGHAAGQRKHQQQTSGKNDAQPLPLSDDADVFPKTAALIAGLFVLFDNALLVQSKFILIDSFLLVFGFAALYFFLQSRDIFPDGKLGIGALAASAVFSGLALSIKWTGVAFLGTIGVFLFCLGMQRVARRQIKGMRFLKIILLFAAAPVILYSAFFYIHFSLLPHSGPGDAFMKPRFLESRRAGYPTRDFFQDTWELNREMFAANQRLNATHSYSSTWYEWPFMTRSVYYWAKETPSANIPTGIESDPAVPLKMDYFRIYLLGNPAVWWISTLGVAVFFLGLATRTLKRIYAFLFGSSRQRNFQPRESAFPWMFLAFGYAANLLPFIFIGRVMFLYHYLTALIFAVVISSLWISRIRRFHKSMLIAVVLLTIAGFIIMAPITYGTALDEPWPKTIFWFKGWI